MPAEGRIIVVVDGVPGDFENRPLGEFEFFADAKAHAIHEANVKHPGKAVAAIFVIDEIKDE
jgi:hypothetical protein